MVGHLQAKALADALEGMAKGSVPEVVHQSSSKCLSHLRIFYLMYVPADDFHQYARGVEHSDTMGQPRVRCAWIDQIGKSKLLHTSKPLKRFRLDGFPKNPFELVSLGIEFDEIMQGITNSLSHN
ncbi:hypothetical protein ATY78_13355 [Rhizobium sp. R635]|nr:hypothetical protein ATY78_13355 [Rhizobium sp. R635]